MIGIMMINNAKRFASEHIVATCAIHLAEGFGWALILQHYIKGDAFLPVIVGYGLVIISIIFHSYAFINKKA